MENLKITKEKNYLGIYFFESNKGNFNVEFFYKELIIRNENGKVEIILKRDRKIGGITTQKTIENYFNKNQ